MYETPQSLIWLINNVLPYCFSWEIIDRTTLLFHVAKWVSSYATGKYIELRCGTTQYMSPYIRPLFCFFA